MFYGVLNEKVLDKQLKILVNTSLDLKNNDTLKYKHLLNDMELYWYQDYAIRHTMLSKGTLVSYSTGVGKTMIGAGLLKLLLNLYTDMNGVFICNPSALKEMYKKISESTGLVCYPLSGKDSDRALLTRLPRGKQCIYIISYKLLHTIEFSNWFVDNYKSIIGLVVDESHHVANISYTHDIIEAMCRKIEYKCFLTATAFTSDPIQLVRQLTLLDNTYIPDSVYNYLEYYEKEKLKMDSSVNDNYLFYNLCEQCFTRMVWLDRATLGVVYNQHARIVEVTPLPNQLDCSRLEAHKIIKGIKDSPQADALCGLALEYKLKNMTGLISVVHLDIADMLYTRLVELKVKVVKFTGETPSQLRELYSRQLKAREIDCVIITISESIDLPADYIIFYEFDVKCTQMLGRVCRGLDDKELYLDFIITKDTCEEDKFIENVYMVSLWMQNILGQTHSSLLKVGEYLEKRNQVL